MNQRKDLWEKDTLKSPLVFAKPYQEEWSFDRISKTLLRAYIRHAFYFDKEKTKGKEYQTFQVNLSDETIEKLKKCKVIALNLHLSMNWLMNFLCCHIQLEIS